MRSIFVNFFLPTCRPGSPPCTWNLAVPRRRGPLHAKIYIDTTIGRLGLALDLLSPERQSEALERRSQIPAVHPSSFSVEFNQQTGHAVPLPFNNPPRTEKAGSSPCRPHLEMAAGLVVT